MLAAPPAFIAALAGLAMLRVLQAAFVTAFRTRFTLGALVTFVVTIADVSVLNIGAAFWGLLAGLVGVVPAGTGRLRRGGRRAAGAQGRIEPADRPPRDYSRNCAASSAREPTPSLA